MKFKLFGLKEKDQKILQGIINNKELMETARLEEVQVPALDDEIWIVSIDAWKEFHLHVSEISDKPKPKALVWIPRGKKPLPLPKGLPDNLKDYFMTFDHQLEEDDESAKSFLIRLTFCYQVFDCDFWVQEIPTDWFRKLEESPRWQAFEELPLGKKQKDHARNCAACWVELYNRLQIRAEEHWEFHCPPMEEISKYLEDRGDDFTENHIRSCAMCLESTKRLGYMLEGVKIITSERRKAAFQELGIEEE